MTLPGPCRLTEQSALQELAVAVTDGTQFDEPGIHYHGKSAGGGCYFAGSNLPLAR
jgi:hypothetical protein